MQPTLPLEGGEGGLSCRLRMSTHEQGSTLSTKIGLFRCERSTSGRILVKLHWWRSLVRVGGWKLDTWASNALSAYAKPSIIDLLWNISGMQFFRT